MMKKVAIDGQNDQVSALLNNLPGMLYRCQNDSDWSMIFVSDGCESLTGYLGQELLHNHDITYADLIHRDDLKLTFSAVEKALKNKETFSYEYRIYPKSGTVK